MHFHGVVIIFLFSGLSVFYGVLWESFDVNLLCCECSQNDAKKFAKASQLLSLWKSGPVKEWERQRAFFFFFKKKGHQVSVILQNSVCSLQNTTFLKHMLRALFFTSSSLETYSVISYMSPCSGSGSSALATRKTTHSYSGKKVWGTSDKHGRKPFQW